MKGVDKWIKDLEEYALSEILNGNNVLGWKAVEGRSNRIITDIDKAFKVLTDYGVEEALLYERKPLSLTNLEKVVGKKKFGELVGDYIEKPKGAPTLAEESDKRPSYEKNTAREDFKNS